MPVPIDRLVRTRRMTIAVIVERDGRLTVRAPLRMPAAQIDAFVQSHAGWIARTRAKFLAHPPPPPHRYAEGETFLYLGCAYPLRLVGPQRPSLTFDGQAFRLSRSARGRAQAALVRWYKARALELLAERVEALAARHGFHYQRIRISSARTRWGSCSSRGTLSFTYRLVMAPPKVVDYVVVHELVHTRIRNHSKVFWRTVGEIMPGYQERVNWLRKNGPSLAWEAPGHT
jgi:predicted metal-dependent hydrolase